MSARSLHTNDENAPPSANTSRPSTPRGMSARSIDKNFGMKSAASTEESKLKRPTTRRSQLSKSTSVPALEKSTPEPPQAKEAEAPLICSKTAVESVRAALLNGNMELASMFEQMLGDNSELQEALQEKPPWKKFDFKLNYQALKTVAVKIKQCSTNKLAQQKAFIDTVHPIQEEIERYMKSKIAEIAGQLADERATHVKAAETAEAAQRSLQQDCEKKLEMAGMIREQIIAAKEQREQELSNLVEMHHNTLKDMTARCESTQEMYANTREELSAVKAKLAVREEEIAAALHSKQAVEVDFATYKEHHSTTAESQTNAISELRKVVMDLGTEVKEKSQQVEVKTIMVSENQDSIEKLKQMLLEEEKKRREAHNALQELKGNIRVYCRARPGLPGNSPALQVSTPANRLSLQCNHESYNFSFDKIFDGNDGQEDVFGEVSDLVQSALDGYKVCIFAYGQTGSGKTHTMQGKEDPTTWGVIPRSLSQIVKSAIAMQAKGWQWTFNTSFLEVYNESLRDLLHNGADGPAQAHTIIHDNAWGSVVTNMTTQEVTSTDEAQAMEQIRSLMATAARQRSVGQTHMNEQSSRSHSVFAMYLHGVNRELGTELYGALHLVDLAGSERLDKSGSEGARLKETQNINRSLSSMADVFLAKAEGRNHVPFRNSKLTHLLEPCLSGQGKTLMMLNIAPEESHAHETLCSLRFANQVSQCNTGGKPKKFVKTTHVTAASSSQPNSAPSSRPTTPRHETRSAPSSARGNHGRPIFER